MIIITGANGYIGRYLSDFFITKKIKFRSYSRRYDKSNKLTKIVKNYKNIPSSKTIIFLSDESNVNKVSKFSKKKILELVETTKEIIDDKFKKIIYFSSVLVDENKTNSVNFNYILYKKKIEEYIIEKKGIVFRLSNVVGRHFKKDTFFYDRLIAKKTLYISKQTKKDFIFIDDLLDLIYKAVNSDTQGVFNASSGKFVNLHEVLLMIKKSKIHKSNKKHQFRKYKKNIDIAKTKTTFKWSPKYKIEDIINIVLGNR